MADQTVTYTLEIHQEGGSYWAEVKELPGCFASGFTLEELHESVEEAIGLYLSSPDHEVRARHIADGDVVEEQRSFELCDA